MFDRIAPTYDLLNHLLSFNLDKGWRRKACRLLPENGPLLDLCGGTGDFSRAALLHASRARAARDPVASHHLVGREGSATGAGSRTAVVLDFSFPMLRSGMKRKTVPGLLWVQGDALNLPFPSGAFGAVTCGFGMRNLGPRGTLQGLKECLRVLRPGGRLVVLEFFPRPGAVRRFLQKTYFTGLLPALGGLVSGDRGAYAYLSRTMEAYLDRPAFLEALNSAGFQNADWRDLTFGVCSLVSAAKAG